MRRVLTAFANYDHQVDYVQGMNFIVGALLFHANEVMAFWLFVSLIEDCEMRDIYMHGLPGLFKHSHIINILVMENLEDLSDHFMEHNLRVEMYASDWIFGLFASVIPLEHMSTFFSKFYKHKWIFFYQLILSILKFLEKELLQEDELWNILNQIKTQTFLNQAAIGGNGAGALLSGGGMSPAGKRKATG
jgi:Rab-GTPase-TBC domain